jgi:NitT/TauT family transport system ATP-binding protein
LDARQRALDRPSRIATADEVAIRTQALRKTYRQRGAAERTVLEGLNLSVRRGEFLGIVGRSGCGKSTLLRILAGVSRPDGGEANVLGLQPDRIDPGRVVLVFQDYSRSLLPWRTAEANVRFGVERLGLTHPEIARRVADALERVKLTSFAASYPAELSGGMQQRVQLARAIAAHPQILLLDEPFGSLDALTRYELEDELQGLCAEGMTAVLVTHDIEEAVYLADRVVVLGGSPAGIELELNVDLPRPRSQDRTKSSGRFVQMRGALLERLLHGRQG